MKQIVILEVEEGVEYPFTTLETAVQFLCDNYKALDLREDSEVTLWKCELDKPKTKKVICTKTVKQYMIIYPICA